ncbi:hypothetical protein EXIGLDRAFT_225721 [Exidia glandulosa HHB12029]|uniref:Endonuclease/exonuclease/phosphatase domain-containing protein n=1 Tax=Exidia glandulosa HHB12029 TaxID=1314781 RepID=A0A165E9G9_EXIGL|nr:hypothetical protein EXIGLDRAFT_225721 [Exidia glandulosa HHB12029]
MWSRSFGGFGTSLIASGPCFLVFSAPTNPHQRASLSNECHGIAKSWVVIPGRAMVVSINWHLGEKLTLLAVYAPNTAKEQSEFWPKILEVLKKKSHIPKPRILLGDCNNVESAIDRYCNGSVGYLGYV